MPATNTDLIDRYLHAVKFWLPKRQQQDIIAELAEDLHSQVEEREAALNHALSEDDLAAVLKKRGSPMSVANGYLSEQHLINPTLLPGYYMVLKIILLWLIVPVFAFIYVSALFNSAHPERVILAFLGEAWKAGFMTVGIVTTLFVLMDRYRVKFTGSDNWDPRKLPRVPVVQETTSRWNHLGGFIFGMIAVILWVYFMRGSAEFPFPGGPRILLSPSWSYLYWPVLSLAVMGALIELFSFLYPCWWQVRSRVRIIVNAFTLVLVAVVLKFDKWVDISVPNSSAADLDKAMRLINMSIEITLLVIAAIAVVDTVKEIRRLRGKVANPVPILTSM